MVKVAILGAGQIGKAVYKIINSLKLGTDSNFEVIVVDSVLHNANLFNRHICVDIASADGRVLTDALSSNKVTHVVNALPFFLVEKAAHAAFDANCHYLDFTEDDDMADRVMEIFRNSNLTCAVKCGLAPGFINYIGVDLIDQLDSADSLIINVGALPRTVSYNHTRPEHSYNLTWSVDGLVNEYIRPCRIRRNGFEQVVAPLTNQTKVILDGVEYEAAYTSGGVGSLVRELSSVPNVCYMTLRYPGHYRYVAGIVQENFNNFEKIKSIFLEKFPFTDDDVIVVYAEALGKIGNQYSKKAYYNKFYGVDGLTAIQSTTAGAGVAVLELMISKRLTGVVSHSQILLDEFSKTQAFTKYYSTAK